MEKEHKAKISGTILWIVVYLIGMAIIRRLLGLIGITADLARPIYRAVFVLILFFYMRNKKALTYYGIRSLKELDSKALLYYIPFGLMLIAPFVFGVHSSYSWDQVIVFSIDALCIGFIEEILFRAFLFKTFQEKSNVLAIVISSCAFGFIHIVNLFSGADIAITLVQIVFCCAFGFACAVFICRTNNVIPCVLCHGLLDAIGLFWTEETNEHIMYFGMLAVISLAYGIYLLKMDKPATKQIA